MVKIAQGDKAPLLIDKIDGHIGGGRFKAVNYRHGASKRNLMLRALSSAKNYNIFYHNPLPISGFVQVLFAQDVNKDLFPLLDHNAIHEPGFFNFHSRIIHFFPINGNAALLDQPAGFSVGLGKTGGCKKI